MSNSSTEGQAAGSGATEGSGTSTEATTGATTTEAPKTFTQADLDRIVGETKRAERSKFADYDDLKKGAQTVEQQLKEIQDQNKALARDALASKIAAKHKISSEDADLFLTGSDEDTLNAQAARLAAHLKASAKEETPSRRPGGVYAPLEGHTSKTGGSASEERNVVRALFGG